MKVVRPAFRSKVFKVYYADYFFLLRVKEDSVQPFRPLALEALQNHVWNPLAEFLGADIFLVPVKDLPAPCALPGKPLFYEGCHCRKGRQVANNKTQLCVGVKFCYVSCKPVDKTNVSIIVHYFAKYCNFHIDFFFFFGAHCPVDCPFREAFFYALCGACPLAGRGAYARLRPPPIAARIPFLLTVPNRSIRSNRFGWGRSLHRSLGKFFLPLQLLPAGQPPGFRLQRDFLPCFSCALWHS